MPAAAIPESFNVLVKELNSLGLQVIPQGIRVKPADDTATLPVSTDDSSPALPLVKS